MAEDTIIHCEFLGVNRSSATTDRIFESTQRYINPADYAGDTVTWSMEVVALNTDSVAKEIRIVNASGTEQISVSVPSGTSNLTRIRATGTWTPAAGDNIYRIESEGTTSANQVQFTFVSAVVTIVNATKVVWEATILANSKTTPTNVDDTPVTSHNSTDYGNSAPNDAAVIQKVASRFADISTWRLEGILRANGSNFSRARLHNKTTDTGVADSLIQTAVNAITIVSTDFADDVADFTNLHDFVPQWSTSSALNSCRVYVLRLSCKIVNLTKCEIWHQLLTGYSYHAGIDAIDNGRKKYEIGSTTADAVYHHVSAYMESGAVGEVYLYDHGVNDSGVAGVTAKSTFSVAGSYARSSDLQSLLVDNNRFITGLRWISGGPTADLEHQGTWLVYAYGAISARIKPFADVFLGKVANIDKIEFSVDGPTSIGRQEIPRAVLFLGSHTGSNNSADLVDANKDFDSTAIVVDKDIVKNLTDGSEGVITGINGDTITTTLSGGTDDDFDTDDEYSIVKGGNLLAVARQFILTFTVAGSHTVWLYVTDTSSNESKTSIVVEVAE